MMNDLRKQLPRKLFRTLRGGSPNERILHRLHSVVLVFNGLSCSEVAKCYGDSARIVAYWVKRFEEQGIAGLQEEARSGRPSKLTPAQLKKVAAFVEESSQTNGAPIDGKALSAFIKKRFDVSLTVRQCRRIVKQFLCS